MGTELLDKIQRRVGDSHGVFTFQLLSGVTFQIVGRLESGIKLLNEVFFLPLDEAQRILYMDGSHGLQHIDLKLSDRVLPQVKLLERTGGSGVYSYWDTGGNLIPWISCQRITIGYTLWFSYLVSWWLTL